MSKPGLGVRVALLTMEMIVASTLPFPSRAQDGGKTPKRAASGASTLVTVDFGVPEGYPLVKDKLGVYQTPFMGTDARPPLTAMDRFLRLAGVQNLRYEIA